MQYKDINEEVQNWKSSWQESHYMAKLTEKQRERDFREGYMRGFEIATKIADKKNLDMIFESMDTGLLNEMVAYAEKDKAEVTRVEVIQHSEPHNGRAYTNYNAKDVEVQYQDGGKTLKIFCK
jgi:hypothetical protein